MVNRNPRFPVLRRRLPRATVPKLRTAFLDDPFQISDPISEDPRRGELRDDNMLIVYVRLRERTIFSHDNPESSRVGDVL